MSTTTVEVAFPSDHPIPSVSVKPLAGWTYTVQKQHLATPVAVLALAAAVAALVRGRRGATTAGGTPT